ncbi:hypothetical protein Patl1_08482 [Pistacia atlantica]|uniref:Uncharacterized protein n=1 Tax=Pistacia atlantica TaxID=434234 RepID=A0ACC1AFY4_9ROSI|nr:hypothetical protein Patl1_08482 [Pistacia atlantica]
MAKEVLKTHDLAFCNRPALLAMRKLTYNGLDFAFAPYNDSWREKRKLCVMHLFNTNRVQKFRPTREDKVSRMIQKISKSVAASKPVNLRMKRRLENNFKELDFILPGNHPRPFRFQGAQKWTTGYN